MTAAGRAGRGARPAPGGRRGGRGCLSPGPVPRGKDLGAIELSPSRRAIFACGRKGWGVLTALVSSGLFWLL